MTTFNKPSRREFFSDALVFPQSDTASRRIKPLTCVTERHTSRFDSYPQRTAKLSDVFSWCSIRHAGRRISSVIQHSTMHHNRSSGVCVETVCWPDGPVFESCWSRCPRGLRRGSAADRLLGLRVRIPAGAWMFVSYVKDKKTKCMAMKTKKEVRLKYEHSTRE